MPCVYVLSNKSIPGLLKIGFTGGDAETRAAEISRGTGVPKPFEVTWFVETLTTDLAYAVEQEVHSRLSNSRYNQAREFFTASIAEVIDCIDSVCYQLSATHSACDQIARDKAEEYERAQQQRIEEDMRAAEDMAQFEREQRMAESEADAMAMKAAYGMPYIAKNQTDLQRHQHNALLREMVAQYGHEETMRRINEWVKRIKDFDRHCSESGILATPYWAAG